MLNCQINIKSHFFCTYFWLCCYFFLAAYKFTSEIIIFSLVHYFYTPWNCFQGVWKRNVDKLICNRLKPICIQGRLILHLSFFITMFLMMLSTLWNQMTFPKINLAKLCYELLSETVTCFLYLLFVIDYMNLP